MTDTARQEAPTAEARAGEVFRRIAETLQRYGEQPNHQPTKGNKAPKRGAQKGATACRH